MEYQYRIYSLKNEPHLIFRKPNIGWAQIYNWDNYEWVISDYANDVFKDDYNSIILNENKVYSYIKKFITMDTILLKAKRFKSNYDKIINIFDSFKNYDSNYFTIRKNAFDLYNYFDDVLKMNINLDIIKDIFSIDDIKTFMEKYLIIEKDITKYQIDRIKKTNKILNIINDVINSNSLTKELYDSISIEKAKLIFYYTNGDWENDIWANENHFILSRFAKVIGKDEFEKLIDKLKNIDNDFELGKTASFSLAQLFLNDFNYQKNKVFNHITLAYLANVLECSRSQDIDKYKVIGKNAIQLAISLFLKENNSLKTNNIDDEKLNLYLEKRAKELNLYYYLCTDKYIYLDYNQKLFDFVKIDDELIAVIGALTYSFMEMDFNLSFINDYILHFINVGKLIKDIN